jgi:ATP-dependent RNA helicase SUPV3L1/SUV3
MLKETNEEIEIINYSRFNQLIVENSLNGDFKNIQKRDCIVVFSQRLIYQIKELIELETGLKCCFIYGVKFLFYNENRIYQVKQE